MSSETTKLGICTVSTVSLELFGPNLFRLSERPWPVRFVEVFAQTKLWMGDRRRPYRQAVLQLSDKREDCSLFGRNERRRRLIIRAQLDYDAPGGQFFDLWRVCRESHNWTWIDAGNCSTGPGKQRVTLDSIRQVASMRILDFLKLIILNCNYD